MDTLASSRERVESANSDVGRLQALIDLASALYESDASEAIEVADAAIALSGRLGDPIGESWARHHRAWSLASLGRLDEAMSEQLSVLDVFEKAGHISGVANALMAIGDLYSEVGDISTALDYLEKAQGPVEAAADPVAKGVLLNLTGIALSHEGRHEEAYSHFASAEKAFILIADPVRVPMAKINQAFELLTMMGADPSSEGEKIVEAERLAEEAIACGVELGDDGRNTVAYGWSLLARVAGARGELEKAVEQSNEGEAIARAGGFDLLAADTALDRTGWLTTMGCLAAARELLDRVAAAAPDNPRVAARVAESEADLLEAVGDYQGALRAHRTFHRLEGELHSDAAERRAQLTSIRFEVENARREAQLAQRRIAELEALDHDKRDFLASVSHELRTPLAAVLGFATELSEAWDGFTPEEARSLVGLIARQSADISSIVDDLLTITRLEAGTMTVYPVRVDLAAELGGLVESMSREASREVILKASAEIFADPTRLRQIIRNLLTNAFRYGGNHVRVEIVEALNSVDIEVRDSGGPIAESRVATMFDPFEHADDGGRTPNSVGLGLAVARSLARMMSGDLVYLYDGFESNFCLTLPKGPPTS